MLTNQDVNAMIQVFLDATIHRYKKWMEKRPPSLFFLPVFPPLTSKRRPNEQGES